MKKFDYSFTMRELTKEEGGGFLIEFPDLPGCMSDGETIEEAIANGRVPKSIRLVRQAKREGVSLNTLVVFMIAEALGEKTSHPRPLGRSIPICRSAGSREHGRFEVHQKLYQC